MDGGRNTKRVPIKSWQPQLKEKLRQSCLQRVKQDRERLLRKIRFSGMSAQAPKEVAVLAFGEILSDEIGKFKLTAGSQQGSSQEKGLVDMLWEYEAIETLSDLGQEDYEELMIAMENILHEEFQAEERGRDAALLKEYENTCALEEQSLANLLEYSKDGELLCPICRIGYLQKKQHIIYCRCGHLRLDIGNDEVDLEFLRKRLAEVLQHHHDFKCKGQPTFSIDNRFGVSALYMQCGLCESFELVI